MKFSERWLRTMCDPPLDSAALCERADDGGLEVEEAEPAAPPFAGVVVGAHRDGRRRIRTPIACACARSTSARPSSCTIVCGAPNAAAGMTAPCALEGATLPGGLAIKRATMRGVESQRHAVLGEGARHRRRRERPARARPTSLAPGTDVRDALALDDTLITLKITPNRADCLSVRGHRARRRGDHRRAAVAAAQSPRRRSRFDGDAPVRVEDSAACPRFVARADRRHRSAGADARLDEAAPRAQRASARSRRSSTSPTT